MDRAITAEQGLLEKLVSLVNEPDGEEDYSDLLFRRCKQGSFRYPQILEKAKAPEKGIPCFPIRPMKGLDLSKCESSSLLLACAARFGLNKDILQWATKSMIVDALAKIEEPQMFSDLYQDLMAVLANSYSDEDSMIRPLKSRKIMPLK